MEVEASAPFEESYADGTSGLVGTLEVAVVDGQGNVVIGPTGSDIIEEEIAGVPSGIYVWSAPAAPGTLGQYWIIFSPDGTWDPDTNSIASPLEVVAAGSISPSPIPQPSDGGPGFGPGTAWTTAEDVAECCNAAESTDGSEFEPFVDTASQLLFTFSGRLFYGLGSKDGMRPPCNPRCGCGGQVLEGSGYVVPAPRTWDWWGVCSGPCEPSRVLLSGYPVREVTQVKIDGVVLDPSEYRLERNRWLVRKNDGVWPSHQNLSLDDTEEDTWSVSYTFGQNPPLAGQDAAKELACQLYKNCNGDASCAIPQGAVRIVRQGLTIERGALRRDPKTGAWATGMFAVDMFLNAYNPRGLIRRPMVQSPARHLRYAKRVA